MESRDTIPTGLVHGRFQPPHNGHVRYLLAALEKAEHVIVGICTPRICTEEEAARTGYPCTSALNPFSYEERCGMITAALGEAGILAGRYSFVRFPSDYAGLGDIVPPHAVFLMSVTGAGDERKIAHIRSQGYEAQAVIEIPEREEREHSGAVRESVRLGTDAWKALVPEAVRAHMEAHGLVERLRE